MADVLDHARRAVADLDALRAALVARAPDEGVTINRLVDEAQHFMECAVAAAGAHPSPRVDAEAVRPSKQPRSSVGAGA